MEKRGVTDNRANAERRRNASTLTCERCVILSRVKLRVRKNEGTGQEDRLNMVTYVLSAHSESEQSNAANAGTTVEYDLCL